MSFYHDSALIAPAASEPRHFGVFIDARQPADHLRDRMNFQPVSL